jgi:23S rRNA (pseudouridine1915-N3)-methyltransferase
MKLQFVVIGKTLDKHLDALIQEYAGRVKHYLPFEMEVIPELKNTKSLSFEQQKQREAELLQKTFREGDYVVLLDENGREFTSVEFANYLQQKQSVAARRLVFVVGGPYGFAPEIYALAKEKISLSRMTFSHQMVRLFFVEQLYRGLTILRGEPYHHE